MEQRIARLRKALANTGVDALLITGPENRRYLSGFTGSSAYLLISANKASLITDFRYLEQAAKEAPGFQVVTPEGTPDETLASQLSKQGINKVGFEPGQMSYSQYKSFQRKFSDTEMIPLDNLAEELREVKDESEIKLLDKAVQIADRAFEHILDYLKPGITEREIAIEIEYYMKRRGAEKSAFEIIVASGSRSALPHGVATDKELEAGDFIVMDFGACYRGYHSDMTRTVVLGKATDEQKKIYNIVLEAQQRALEQMEPGKKCNEIDATARDYITEQGYGVNFGHSLGHSVGLAVHEKPALAPKDETVLEAGMALTVEPGIYISDWGGVRIEDIAVITAESKRILTCSTKKLLEI